MITRDKVIGQAVMDCLKELYKWVQPEVSWKDFVEQNKNYKDTNLPKPFEFYYLDDEICKSIVENYIYAYNLDPDLKGIIKILIDYCEKPIIDKWIEVDEEGFKHSGHRGYDYPEGIINFIGEEHWDKVKEFLDMAGSFFKWDGNLQKFKFNVYLGSSPCSNKETVINNWKEFRNKDIEIKDIKEEFENEYYI